MNPEAWDRHIRRQVRNTYRGVLSEMKWEAVRKENSVSDMTCDICFAFYVEYPDGDRSVTRTRQYAGLKVPEGREAEDVACERLRAQLIKASLMGPADKVVVIGTPTVTWPIG